MTDQPPQDPRPPSKDDLSYYDGERVGDETPFFRRWALPVALVLVVGIVAVLARVLMRGEEEDPPVTTTTTTTTP